MSYKLNTRDMLIIEEYEDDVEWAIEIVATANKFKVGDYVVQFVEDYDSNGNRQDYVFKNSYGLPHKYVCVYVNKYNMAHFKIVNNKGNPIGDPIAAGSRNRDGFWFELDPDYADHLILNGDEPYDPHQTTSKIVELRKEIIKHNSSVTLNTENEKAVANIVRSLKVGKTLYTPRNGFFTVTHLDEALPFYPHNPDRIYSTDFGLALSHTGKEIPLNRKLFLRRLLYAEPPRSFRELKF